MQFDRHGNRIWRPARELLDDEHARYAVGSVAVPYGTCTEPSEGSTASHWLNWSLATPAGSSLTRSGALQAAQGDTEIALAHQGRSGTR